MAGPEVTVALIVCFTLAVGAATRMLSDRVHVPYTIAMLVIGLAVGLLLEQLQGIEPVAGVLERLNRGSAISPELVIFIFLPVLVFESAFGLDVHAFRKNLGIVLMLAGPAMVASTVAIAVAMVGLTAFSWQWAWLPALVFGALISATDPVAVVALLREVGAPRRLGLLIEGESLLNDGTAIVLFSVLIGVLTGTFAFAAGGALLHFLWVTTGGLVVGLALAIGVTTWLSRVFNAPLIEITLTVVLAYLSMLVAEGFLHVSGVIAVVSAGLWMSGRGRLHISPEVSHFLHRFWEMLAYLANTLIFFLVGLVIATQVQDAVLLDFLVISLAFASITGVRFGLAFLLRPLMNRLGDPVDVRETAVVSWGGLRGAVSLALALVVSQHPDVPAALGHQVLMATAGVALLTILVNGSTLGWLLRRLGLDRPPPGDRIADLATRASVLERVAQQIARVSDARDLRTVDWSEVRRDLESREESLSREIRDTRRELEAQASSERARGYWRQALNVEREGFWAAFARGTLSPQATRILDHEIDLQLDRLSHGEERPHERLSRGVPSWRARLARWRARPGHAASPAEFELLALRYDLYRAEQLAAERVLADLEARTEIDADVRDEIRRAYRSWLHASKESLEDLRVQLPEVTRAIETRLARRIQLNLERESYEELARVGAIEPLRVQEAQADVQRRMKALYRSERRMALPEPRELCRHAPLFEKLDEAAIEQVAAMTTERVFAPDEILCHEGERGDSMFIIARGAVAVVRERATPDGTSAEVLDILGGGDILGEMSLLAGASRNATARALTTVTVGEISCSAFEELMETQPALRETIWQSFSERRFDNHVRRLPEYAQLGREDRMRWFRRGEVVTLNRGETLHADGAAYAFVVTGAVDVDGTNRTEGALVALRPDVAIHALEQSRIARLPSALHARGVPARE